MGGSTLDAILSQYNKNKDGVGTSKNSDNLKGYYNPYLQKGTKTGEDSFRLLPPNKDGQSIFAEGHFHQVFVGGKKQKIYCNRRNDKGACPLCDTGKTLWESGRESDKEIAKTFFAKKHYIVKGILRGKEEDGVKFWRFPEHAKAEGIYDKILPIFSKKGDISDPKEGRDLEISLVTDKFNKIEFTKVSSIQSSDPSPLIEDKEKMKEWLTDTREWKDMFKPKPIEYLEIVSRMEVPVWDKDKEKYVSENAAPESPEEEELDVTLGDTKKESGNDSSDGVEEMPWD